MGDLRLTIALAVVSMAAVLSGCNLPGTSGSLAPAGYRLRGCAGMTHQAQTWQQVRGDRWARPTASCGSTPASGGFPSMWYVGQVRHELAAKRWLGWSG
jgi:hypothetical protein